MVLAALLAIHGLIHLLGFLKPWKLARVEQLSGRAIVPLSETAGRVVGLFWLSAALLLLAAAAFGSPSASGGGRSAPWGSRCRRH